VHHLPRCHLRVVDVIEMKKHGNAPGLRGEQQQRRRQRAAIAKEKIQRKLRWQSSAHGNCGKPAVGSMTYHKSNIWARWKSPTGLIHRATISWIPGDVCIEY
jgi:hypothetical protein